MMAKLTEEQAVKASDWEARRHQFKNAAAGNPTVDSWAKKREKFLAEKAAGQQDSSPAKSNIQYDPQYISQGDNQQQAQQAAPPASPLVSPEENARQENVVNNANGFDRFMFGVINGLMDVGKGGGLFNDMTPEEQAAIKSVQQKLAAKPSTAQDVGEFAGQVAPFLGTGGLISQVPKGAARLAAAAGVGATEGGIVAKGTGNDVATGAAIGAVAGPVAELAGPALGAIGSKVKAGAQSAREWAGSLRRPLMESAPDSLGVGAVGSIGPTPNSSGIEAVISQSTDPQQLKQLENTAEATTNAAKKKGAAADKFAGQIKPDQNVLEAASRLGLDNALTPGMYSQNPSYRAFENALAATPGTKLYQGHRAAIARIGNAADQFITDFGGSLDKGFMNREVANRYDDIVGGLQRNSDILYDKITKSVPKSTRVETNNIIDVIDGIADEVGGMEALKAIHPEIYKVLRQTQPNVEGVTTKAIQEGEPAFSPATYGRLDAIRKQVGEALGKKAGRFKDEDRGYLSKMYSALTGDQEIVARQHGMGEVWNTAKEMVNLRKQVEANSTLVLGKNGTRDVVPRMESAMVDLAKGQSEQFKTLTKNLPEDMRSQVVLTAMNKAFTTFAKSPGQQLGVPGFVKWYNGMLRNKSNLQTLNNTIGYDAARRMHNLYVVSSGANRIGSEKVYSSSQIDRMLKNFDKEGGAIAKAYGLGKNIIKAEGLSSAASMPGVGTAGVIGAAIASQKTARTVAADEFLSSSAFRATVRDVARGATKSAPAQDGILNALNKRITNTPQWKKLSKTLGPDELKQVSRVGALWWLMSPQDGDQQ